MRPHGVNCIFTAAWLDAFVARAEPALEHAGEQHVLGRLLSVHAELAAMRGLALNAIAESHLLQGDLVRGEPILEQAAGARTPDMELRVASLSRRYSAQC